jgi:hypothetical protein
MINLINQRLNNIDSITSNQDEIINNEYTSNDDDERNTFYYNIYNNSEDVSNSLINDYSNDFYYANNNNNIENILSAYIGGNNILENVLNLSFEEAPTTISKNENQEIKLEEVIYTKSDGDETCTICLSLLENGDSIGHLDCNHKFHFDCINEWCKYKSQCPMCRYEVPIK